MSSLASGLHRLRRSPWEVVLSALVSCGLVLFSQLAVATVPRFFPSLSLLAMLPVAGLVFLAAIVVGRFWRRFIGVAASAPLFVLFNVLFMWGVYIFVIRGASNTERCTNPAGLCVTSGSSPDTSSLLDMLINAECALLLWGLYRILSGDPGIVAYESSFLEEAGCNDFVDAICSSEKHPSLSRVRHCNSCKANVRGYDHHCPAFGNCIGQKNHRLFIALLTGFVVAESTYTMCSTKYITRCINSGTIRTENPLSLNMVIGTMLFSVLQVLWQVVFLIWHVYGICFNIKTDEWVMSNFPCFGLFLHQLQVVFSFAVSCS
ncbi:palmitoyltransferase ZDHHC16 isoform X2 [Brachypodium distachyon]|uniref:palmitoyltransferase ZDHHC16 isoform X2 n=1 Tax=Brachypodium distachyon TaxID=15368 RepID=UPI00053005FB|nr:palmitoyltransferase ZDHHC16 isoform X2 [Brachypodium distachyon]|eukprot:XP_010228797.1 palmitoyltransferase ZDHHC16 isoform X2 [Brachypodium distachyon]